MIAIEKGRCTRGRCLLFLYHNSVMAVHDVDVFGDKEHGKTSIVKIPSGIKGSSSPERLVFRYCKYNNAVYITG